MGPVEIQGCCLNASPRGGLSCLQIPPWLAEMVLTAVAKSFSSSTKVRPCIRPCFSIIRSARTRCAAIRCWVLRINRQGVLGCLQRAAAPAAAAGAALTCLPACLQVDVRGDVPHFMNPVLAACQLVNVSEPGKEPQVRQQ